MTLSIQQGSGNYWSGAGFSSGSQFWNLASLGHARQLVNLPGYALMVNALAIRRYGTASAQAA